jgi:acetyl-CoA acetyltransferase family protein
MITLVYDAIRTPFGRAGGALAEARPDDLAAHSIRSLLARNEVDPAEIGDVILGDANQAGEDNRNVARFAALLAGLPTSVTGTTVNRLCASSLEAVIQGARAIETGDARVIIAGGVESMSRAPYVLEKSAKPWSAIGNPPLWNTSIGWRMVNPEFPTPWTISNGQAAEKIAQELGISRDAQDEFAARSHRRAADAWAAGVFDREVVPVPGVAKRGVSFASDATLV